MAVLLSPPPVQETEEYKAKLAADRLELENQKARQRNKELVQLQMEAEVCVLVRANVRACVSVIIRVPVNVCQRLWVPVSVCESLCVLGLCAVV